MYQQELAGLLHLENKIPFTIAKNIINVNYLNHKCARQHEEIEKTFQRYKNLTK